MKVQEVANTESTTIATLAERLRPFASRRQLERTAYVFKAIGDPIRLQILSTLGDSEMSVQDIAEALGASHSNVSRHLGLLLQGGVLLRRRDASRALYRVSDRSALALVVVVREVFTEQRP